MAGKSTSPTTTKQATASGGRTKSLRGAANSILIYGFYLVVLGAVLVLTPNLLLELLDLPRTQEVWLRAGGILVAVMGAYYVLSARENIVAFWRWSIYGRAAMMATFLSLVIVGWGPWQLLIFGTIDVLGAMWTAMTLQSATGRPRRRRRTSTAKK